MTRKQSTSHQPSNHRRLSTILRKIKHSLFSHSLNRTLSVEERVHRHSLGREGQPLGTLVNSILASTPDNLAKHLEDRVMAAQNERLARWNQSVESLLAILRRPGSQLSPSQTRSFEALLGQSWLNFELMFENLSHYLPSISQSPPRVGFLLGSGEQHVPTNTIPPLKRIVSGLWQSFGERAAIPLLNWMANLPTLWGAVHVGVVINNTFVIEWSKWSLVELRRLGPADGNKPRVPVFRFVPPELSAAPSNLGFAERVDRVRTGILRCNAKLHQLLRTIADVSVQWNANPQYHVLRANCQHFALHLINHIHPNLKPLQGKAFVKLQTDNQISLGVSSKPEFETAQQLEDFVANNQHSLFTPFERLLLFAVRREFQIRRENQPRNVLWSVSRCWAGWRELVENAERELGVVVTQG